MSCKFFADYMFFNVLVSVDLGRGVGLDLAA